MGIAIRIKGALPEGNYPSLWDFITLPQEKLLESWSARSLVTQAGGLVSEWQGARGVKAIQATSAKRPLYVDNPVFKFVGFDGVDDLLTTSRVLPAEGYLVVGIKNTAPPSTVGNDVMIGAEDPTATNRIWFGRKKGVTGCNYGVGIGGHALSSGYIDPAVNPYGSYDVVGLHYSADHSYRLRVNGTVRLAGNAGTFTVPYSPIYVGDRNKPAASAVFTTSVQFGVIAVYDGVLSDQELARIDQVMGVMIGRA